MADPNQPAGHDERTPLELAQTAQARYETTEAAAASYGFDLERAKLCEEMILERIHRGPVHREVLWVVEVAQAMMTAVMAVQGDPLPVSTQVDAASYGMSVLRDLATAARSQDLDWELLEEAAAGCLRAADEAGYSNLEVYWGLNRACASLELAWARSLTDKDS
jgi:hypothetical protein